MRIFIGTDSRHPVAVQVLMHSIYKRASRPVQITPLVLPQLPIKRRGLTEFTYSRYLPPFLCGYKGHSLFLDADMLVLGDVWELDELCRSQLSAVCVVKNPLRFEWPSVMYFNNAHCQKLTPEWIDDEANVPQRFEWAQAVGEIPGEWNHLVGYDAPRANPKLIHYTAGVPLFPETRGCEHSDVYLQEARDSMGSVTWKELMGNSVHVKRVAQGMAA